MTTGTTAAEPSGRNVLDDLDSRIPTGFYWYLAVLACIGGFLFGYDTSNIGSALNFVATGWPKNSTIVGIPRFSMATLAMFCAGSMPRTGTPIARMAGSHLGASES